MATPPFHVKALYDYNSNEADDLSFSNGQIIQVTDEEDADWYYGEYADTAGERHEGLFPKNFVKIYEPETPARPSRTSRPKKETEISSINGVEHPPIKESEASSVQRASTSIPVQEADVIAQALEQKQLPPPQPSETGSIAASLRSSAASKQTPTTASKPTSPLAAEKPASGSFRDRINAFNKSTAPPPAPLKPSGLGASGGSGFVKKPFVAPPPSKNAYVPPPREAPAQKVYRREEDNEPLAQASNVIENDEQPSGPQIPVLAGNEEGQQKPTSLKERIALLQKQQMEQAARHAEAGQKKEKPKRPSRKQVEPQGSTADQEDDAEGEILDRINSAETTSKRLIEGSHDAAVPGARSITRSRKSREATPVGSPLATPAREFLSDPNDADQSGIGDTEDGEELSTGRDDSDEKPRRTISTPPQRPSQLPSGEADVGDEEDDVEEDDAEEEDEENVDPEVQRRIEIRERMAKMSGGMGMAGMFGPPGGMPPRTLTKQGTHSSERNGSGNSISTQRDSSGNRAPPVPILSSPGLQRVRSPEQFNAQPAIGKEETDAPKSIVEGRVPEDMPDVEDMGEEPIRPQRRSTERPAPPPILQGYSSVLDSL